MTGWIRIKDLCGMLELLFDALGVFFATTVFQLRIIPLTFIELV